MMNLEGKEYDKAPWKVRQENKNNNTMINSWSMKSQLLNQPKRINQ